MSDARDVHGTTWVVTGANTGIGKVTAERLAAAGAHVVLACRSREKSLPVVEGITARGCSAEFLELDLGSLADVRRTAADLLGRGKPLHGLINNAGLAGQRGTTRDGFELAFGTNHLGHFLLTLELLPLLRASGNARVITVASRAHLRARGFDWAALRRPTASTTGVPEYGVSKLANVVFARELARRHGDASLRSCSLHPGVVASDVWRSVPWPVRSVIKLFMLSNEQGATTTLHCALAQSVNQDPDGAYYARSRVARHNPLADGAALGRELWDKSLEWTNATS